MIGGSPEGCPFVRAPFCWGVWGMCCDGTMEDGWWIADMVEEAVGPAENAGTT